MKKEWLLRANQSRTEIRTSIFLLTYIDFSAFQEFGGAVCVSQGSLGTMPNKEI